MNIIPLSAYLNISLLVKASELVNPSHWSGRTLIWMQGESYSGIRRMVIIGLYQHIRKSLKASVELLEDERALSSTLHLKNLKTINVNVLEMALKKLITELLRGREYRISK